MPAPIRIHPKNPKVFLFREKPLVLATACEHYGGVMNRPFDYTRYLEDTAKRGINYTRLFTLFRELQSAANPYSTCKPESTDYIAPFRRVGRERALDMQPKYDLDLWSDEFLERLHGFLAKASACDVIVELVLFSNAYGAEGWSLNPLHAANNHNRTENIPWYQYNTLRHPVLNHYQETYARRMVQETNAYDNVIIEICNEPGGGVGAPDSPDPEEVNAWLDHGIRLVRETEAQLPNQRLIVGQEAFAYKLPEEAFNPIDVHQFCERSFDVMDYDVVNMHPLSNMKHRGKTYNLGRFMHAQMRLKEYRDYCLALYPEPKPLNLDEDNCATQYREPLGWTIHRKRAWTALFCGAHYNLIDFSILHCLPTGTPQSQRLLRDCIGFLLRTVHTFDLQRACPLQGVVASAPPEVCDSVFGVLGEDMGIYLADAREAEEPEAGAPLRGALKLRLPNGRYWLSCVSPLTGAASPEISIQVTEETLSLELPEFQHDLLVRVRRAE